jgi:F-type H+-transporting ATPase subunit a
MVHISLRAEEIFQIGSFPVTNALLMSALTFIVLAGGALLLYRKISLVPGKGQSISELILEAVLDLMDSVLGDRRKSERYLPIVTTIFLFVICSNWLGLLPGVGSITFNTHEGEVPLFRSAAADLNFTLALSVIAVVAINLIGILAIGIKKHTGKFFDFSNPINFFVGILELVSEFAKIISFSFRLFGNVFAGEVLLTIVAFLVPYVIPLPFLFLETFVGFIQAFVFAMLALVFIAISTAEHGAEEHAHQ